MNPIGIYIHAPFCTEKCPYCDFYSMPRAFSDMDAYTKAVIRDLRAYAGNGLQADTLYFGGGTPSLLGAARIGEIIGAVREWFGLSKGEITVEVNPTAQETWLENLFHGFAQAGVNRISVGMQSANEMELRQLGRRHTPRQAGRTVELARAAGISHVSLDLMLAIPGQTPESLMHTLAFCGETKAEHLSAYLLKIEPGTPFDTQRETLRPLLPQEEQVEELYLLAVAELERQGYEQYEISNFARRQNGVLLEGKHNKKYWCAQEYLGIGPSAHSYLFGKRFYSPADLGRFLQGCQTLPDGDGGGREEFAMLRLRLREGLCDSVWQAQFSEPLPRDYVRRAKKFVPAGLVRLCDTEPGFSLTPKGFLLSNALIGEILFGRS